MKQITIIIKCPDAHEEYIRQTIRCLNYEIVGIDVQTLEDK